MEKNNFICLDDEFSYSRCVFQCNDCALYEKQLDENKNNQKDNKTGTKTNPTLHTTEPR